MHSWHVATSAQHPCSHEFQFLLPSSACNRRGLHSDECYHEIQVGLRGGICNDQGEIRTWEQLCGKATCCHHALNWREQCHGGSWKHISHMKGRFEWIYKQRLEGKGDCKGEIKAKYETWGKPKYDRRKGKEERKGKGNDSYGSSRVSKRRLVSSLINWLYNIVAKRFHDAFWQGHLTFM